MMINFSIKDQKYPLELAFVNNCLDIAKILIKHVHPMQKVPNNNNNNLFTFFLTK